MRLFSKREPSVLFYNAPGFIISAYSLILTYNVLRIYHKSCWCQLSYCGLHVRAVSVFGNKSDAVCGFLAYFCAVLRFSDPPYAPLSSRITGEWAEQTGGGEGAQIFKASQRLPSLSYIATAKEIHMCDEISCARARTQVCYICTTYRSKFCQHELSVGKPLGAIVINNFILFWGWSMEGDCSGSAWTGRSVR